MRLASPLVSFDVFRSYFADHQTRKQMDDNHPQEVPEEEAKEATDGARNKGLLPYFLEERVKLKALVHLPSLVSFYKLLRECFAYKITQEESSSKTVLQCIALLANDGTQNAEHITSAWESFKKAWTGKHLSFPFSLPLLSFISPSYFQRRDQSTVGGARGV